MITNAAFEDIFNDLFCVSENTQLVNGLILGESEPLYRPADQQRPAQIIYAQGFLRSAFHEVAHWCYAGAARRQIVDYGYWYVGDCRNQSQQDAFEQVELVPQAYELLLCEAAGIDFQVSLDNFNQSVCLNRALFTQKVKAMAKTKANSSLSPRLKLLLQRLKPF